MGITFANTEFKDIEPALLNKEPLWVTFRKNAEQSLEKVQIQNARKDNETAQDTDGNIETYNLQAGYTSDTDRFFNLIRSGHIEKAALFLTHLHKKAQTPSEYEKIAELGHIALDILNTAYSPQESAFFKNTLRTFGINLEPKPDIPVIKPQTPQRILHYSPAIAA